jgi:hypothetical protein
MPTSMPDNTTHNATFFSLHQSITVGWQSPTRPCGCDLKNRSDESLCCTQPHLSEKMGALLFHIVVVTIAVVARLSILSSLFA